MSAGKTSWACTMSLWRHGWEWYELILRCFAALYLHTACLSHSTDFHTGRGAHPYPRGRNFWDPRISAVWRCVVPGVLLHLSNSVFLLELSRACTLVLNTLTSTSVFQHAVRGMFDATCTNVHDARELNHCQCVSD